MYPITKNDIENAVKTLRDNNNGTVYQVVGYTQDGQGLYLVMGYQDGYEKGEKYQTIEGEKIYTLCGKLACNVSSLQCDYDVDWYMPWQSNGDVYDTDTAITDDFQSLADFYNQSAKEIIALMNKGDLVVE